MIRYEGLLLTAPQISDAEISALESSIDKIIQSKQGSMVSFERWGKYKLAYPVQKNEYGVYFLTRFDLSESTSTAIADMKMLFETKMGGIVMRSLFTRLPEGQPLAYQRPKSLEEAPAREEFQKERHHHDHSQKDDFYASPKDDNDKETDNIAE
jgi:small subunit ribosomal protein S6